MEDLSLHILDVAENSIAAGAKHISIIVEEDDSRDILSLEIADDGKGMDPETVKRATDPFYTTRTTRRVGLGLALLQEAAHAAEGDLNIQSRVGEGTKVRATFRLSHIDLKPMGNMAETLTALVASSSEVDLRYVHRWNGHSFTFDTREIRDTLSASQMSPARVLAFMRDYLTKNIHYVQVTSKHIRERRYE
jgi:anti-sigma regulatory factor (Ser/Thr protein kinase)